MNLTRDRARSIGWAFILTVCLAATLALSFRVNALKSEVRLTERQIISLRRDTLLLETEFATRANQQQLRALNEVEFGFSAPTAGQYLEGERQLAALGKPRPADAPAPIRVASAADGDRAPFPVMVSPITGKTIADDTPARAIGKPAAASLDARLSRVRERGAARE